MKTATGNMINEAELAGLRADIVARHGTVYRFWRRSKTLGKSLVYTVLNGKYSGNLERQAARIRQVLETGVDDSHRQFVSEADVYRALEKAACALCRNRDGRKCRGCARLFAAQARKVMEVLS